MSSWTMKLTSFIWWWDWACMEVHVYIFMNLHGMLLRALSHSTHTVCADKRHCPQV
jgi:hypothetical protein